MRKVTKKQIIKAISTEHLKPGYWILPQGFKNILGEGGKKPISNKCTVCAVGAVLRSALPRNTRAEYLDNIAWDVTGNRAIPNTDEDVFEVLKEKNFLGALSLYFEDACTKAGGKATPAVRKKTIAFVEAHFPDKLELDI